VKINHVHPGFRKPNASSTW